MAKKIKEQIAFWATIPSGIYTLYLLICEVMKMKTQIANYIIILIFLISLYITIKAKFVKIKERYEEHLNSIKKEINAEIQSLRNKIDDHLANHLFQKE